jgi:hypothetical protein
VWVRESEGIRDGERVRVRVRVLRVRVMGVRVIG